MHQDACWWCSHATWSFTSIVICHRVLSMGLMSRARVKHKRAQVWALPSLPAPWPTTVLAGRPLDDPYFKHYSQHSKSVFVVSLFSKWLTFWLCKYIVIPFLKNFLVSRIIFQMDKIIKAVRLNYESGHRGFNWSLSVIHTYVFIQSQFLIV